MLNLEQSKLLTSRITNFQLSTCLSSCTVQFRVLRCTREAFCSLFSSVYKIFQISCELSFLLENCSLGIKLMEEQTMPGNSPDLNRGKTE